MLFPPAQLILNLVRNIAKMSSWISTWDDVFSQIPSQVDSMGKPYMLHDVFSKLIVDILGEIYLCLLVINLLPKSLAKYIHTMQNTMGLFNRSLCKQKNIVRKKVRGLETITTCMHCFSILGLNLWKISYQLLSSKKSKNNLTAYLVNILL